MLAKRFKLIYLSNDLTKKVELRLTRNKAATFVATCVLSCAIASLLVGFFICQLVTAGKVSAIMTEKNELEWQLGDIRGRLVRAEQNLADLQQRDDFLRLLADLPPIDEDVREVGVGGPVDDLAIIAPSPELKPTLWTLEKIERQIQLQMDSFQEISAQLTANQDILDHTPTLRPVDGGWISSGFGYRRDPFTRRTVMHPGVDIAQKRGTPVLATAMGQVTYAGRFHNYGKLVMIDHGYGYQTVYGHLNTIGVKVGEYVQKGQQIGEVGATGRATAPHVHYEVRAGDTPVNPMDYFFDGLAVLPGL